MEGACSSRVFLRSTPPSTGESKFPSQESFPEPLLNDQRARWRSELRKSQGRITRREVLEKKGSGQVVTVPLIDFDLPEKLAEFDGTGDRWPMRLPMLRKASGEIDIGERRGAVFGPKAVRLGIGR
jgi:hypothetical protein